LVDKLRQFQVSAFAQSGVSNLICVIYGNSSTYGARKVTESMLKYLERRLVSQANAT